MSAFSDLDRFYELDERRRRSPEVDYGVWWRWHGCNYRITWVEATGELIAVRLGPTQVRRIGGVSHADGLLALFAGEPMDVYVLATLADRDTAERVLEGWADACGQPDSLAWVARRLESCGQLEPGEELEHRARRLIPARQEPW